MSEEKKYSEMAVLAGMLDSGVHAALAKNILKPEYFESSRHRTLFKLILEVAERQKAVDVLLVGEYAARREMLEGLGGYGYLTEISTCLPVPVMWKAHAALLKENYLKRRQYQAANEFQSTGDTERMIGQITAAEKEIYLLKAENRLSLSQVAGMATGELESSDNIIKTGYRVIDENMPVVRGDLFVIPGRPASGKSLLNINLIQNMLPFGYKILVFTTEMTPQHFFKRQIALNTSVPYFVLRTKKYNLEDVGEINRFCGSFVEKYEKQLFYSANSRPTLGDIVTECETVSPDAVIVDNLSGVKIDWKSKNKTDNIGDFVWGLKGLAVRKECAVFLTCHLSRAAEKGKKEEDEPNLSDIKDSSSLEEAGTHVLLLWSKRKEDPQDFASPKEIRWRAAKDRDGFGGTGVFYLDRKSLKISEG